MGGGHHALQPRSIGSDQRCVFTSRKLCLSDSFQTGLIDVGHEPKLIDALDAVRRRHLEINLMVTGWRIESCCQTKHRKMRDNAHLLTLSENLNEFEIIGKGGRYHKPPLGLIRGSLHDPSFSCLNSPVAGRDRSPDPLVATSGGPTMFARIGVMRALNRKVERMFDRSRKDTRWRNAVSATQGRHAGARCSSLIKSNRESRARLRAVFFVLGSVLRRAPRATRRRSNPEILYLSRDCCGLSRELVSSAAMIASILIAGLVAVDLFKKRGNAK